MGFEDEVERSLRRPCRRQVQADMRAAVVDSLKTLDPNRPIREADIA